MIWWLMGSVWLRGKREVISVVVAKCRRLRAEAQEGVEAIVAVADEALGKLEGIAGAERGKEEDQGNEQRSWAQDIAGQHLGRS